MASNQNQQILKSSTDQIDQLVQEFDQLCATSPVIETTTALVMIRAVAALAGTALGEAAKLADHLNTVTTDYEAAMTLDQQAEVLTQAINQKQSAEQICQTIDLFHKAVNTNLAQLMNPTKYSVFCQLVNAQYEYMAVLQHLKELNCLDQSHQVWLRNRVMATEDQLSRLFPPSPAQQRSRHFRGTDDRVTFGSDGLSRSAKARRGFHI